jgi:hypothetical protein
MGDFRYWPLTSLKALQKGGRYRIKSGQTAPSGLTGSAAFDPLQKWSVHCSLRAYPRIPKFNYLHLHFIRQTFLNKIAQCGRIANAL